MQFILSCCVALFFFSFKIINYKKEKKRKKKKQQEFISYMLFRHISINYNIKIRVYPVKILQFSKIFINTKHKLRWSNTL